jgi:ketol-acid reductoisomerase
MKMGQEPKAAARVAMIGYGDQAREQTLRLRESGWDVRVVVRPGGMSWIRAMADGLRPVTAREAVAGADVVAIHLPEAEQPAMWAQSLAPHVATGALIVFAHGAALYSGALELDERFDVVLVAPGETPDACRVAVHQDATGRALERAAGYARAVFGGAKVGTTTLASEVQSELSELVERVGGLPALLAEWDRVLANPSHEPDQATLQYYERLRAAVLANQPAPIAKPPSSRVAVSPKRGAA